MTVVERKYDRKEFIENGYEIFTKFMFDVCNSEGITVLVSEIETENKVILTAYGSKVDVVRCADCDNSTLEEEYVGTTKYCYWCRKWDDYFKSTEYCSSGVRRQGGAT